MNKSRKTLLQERKKRENTHKKKGMSKQAGPAKQISKNQTLTWGSEEETTQWKERQTNDPKTSNKDKCKKKI